MTRVLIVIPTTGGPAILKRLAPRAGLPVSAAFVDGDYRPLPWSADYARLAGPGGPIARALKREALEPHELRLDRSFDAGRSWEAPVGVAHLLLASSAIELTDAPEAAELVIWTTGAVDLDLALIPGDYAVADKLERSRALFAAAAGAQVVLALPPGTPREVVAAARPRMRVVEAPTASSIAGAALAARRMGPAPKPIDSATAARRSVRPLPLLFGGAALVAAAVAVVAFGPALFGSSPGRTDPPGPTPVPAPVETVVATPQTPPDPPKPPPDPPIAIAEVRAPAGAACAQVLFGAVKAERRKARAVAADAFAPSQLDDRLCGIAVGAVDPGSVRVTVSGGLAAAASPPRPEPDGGFLYMLKAGARQNVVYEVQAVSRTGEPLARMRHELAP